LHRLLPAVRTACLSLRSHMAC